MGSIEQQLLGFGLPSDTIDRAKTAGVNLGDLYATLSKLFDNLGQADTAPQVVRGVRLMLDAMNNSGPLRAAYCDAINEWIDKLFPPCAS